MVGDVHCRTVKGFEDPVFENWDSNAANVPYFTVRSNYPHRYVAAAALLMHCLDGLGHGGPVLRVDGGKILLKRWGAVLRVTPENAIYLVRPIDAHVIGPSDPKIR